MSTNYEHDQERLLNTAAQAVQTAASVGLQMIMNRPKSVKVEIRTAAEDVQDARKAIQQGIPKAEIAKTIQQGEVYQRVAKAGGDPNKYEQLILRRAELDHALELMPPQSLSQAKTPKKTL
jgi:hypothetical protein